MLQIFKDEVYESDRDRNAIISFPSLMRILISGAENLASVIKRQSKQWVHVVCSSPKEIKEYCGVVSFICSTLDFCSILN